MNRSGGAHVINIITCSMPEYMRNGVLNAAIYAVETFAGVQEVAKYLKQYCDERYNVTWHCIVGSNGYGSFVSHARDNSIYFMIDNYVVLLFRTASIHD